MPDHNLSPASAELLSPICDRYSPYRFLPRPIPAESLHLCFEAASWAASSFNEQPWRFIVASRDENPAFERMLGCLADANRPWAAQAGALILTAYRSKFSRNDKPNRVALHDLGQAVAHFAIQATALGLQAHQMAGINLSQIRAEYRIPDEYDPATAIAIGYADTSTPETELQDEWAHRESSARRRHTLSEFVFTRSWRETD